MLCLFLADSTILVSCHSSPLLSFRLISFPLPISPLYQFVSTLPCIARHLDLLLLHRKTPDSIQFHPIISSHLISSHLISSHLISSHLNLSHITSYRITSSPLHSSPLLSHHLISYRLSSHHIISRQKT